MDKPVRKAVRCYLIKDNKVVVTKYNKGNKKEGYYDIPGGKIENGELLKQTAIREVFEETGIKISVGEVFCISSNTKKHSGYNGIKEIPTKIILDFICRDAGGQIRASIENSESRYIEKNKIGKLISNLALLERFKAYLNYNKRPTYLDYESRPNFKLKYKKLL